MSDAVTPFVLNIPQSRIDDLHQRLDLTRWPEKETVDDWSQGAPLAKVRALCDYWRNGYDWRRFEARLNALGQFLESDVKQSDHRFLPLIVGSFDLFFARQSQGFHSFIFTDFYVFDNVNLPLFLCLSSYLLARLRLLL